MTIIRRLVAGALLVALAPVPVFALELESLEFVTASPGGMGRIGYEVQHPAAAAETSVDAGRQELLRRALGRQRLKLSAARGDLGEINQQLSDVGRFYQDFDGTRRTSYGL